MTRSLAVFFLKFTRRASAAMWLCLFLMSPRLALAATEIELWHSMQGSGAEVFAELVQRFNDSQSEIRVLLQFKGDEEAVLAATLEAARLRKPLPHLFQVADDQGGAVLAQRGLARRLDDALGLAAGVDPGFFAPAAASFLRDRDGRQYGYPLEVSVPIFIFNKDAYRAAGLDADAPPRTWRDLQAHLLALRKPQAGFNCAYTTSAQAWIHVENLGASHGETVANKNNGRDGPGAALTFNGLLHVRHTALMMSWVKSTLFTYSGFGRQGDARFVAGECATLSAPSGVIGDLVASPRFAYGVAPMPFHEEGAPQILGSLVGGSGLWASAGKKAGEQAAVARFLAFLSKPEIATVWHQRTGNLPWTEAAYRLAIEEGFYDRVSGLGPFMKTLAEGGNRASPALRGLQVPHHDRVRRVINDQLEAVWNGTKAAKQGLDDAVRLGNAAMRGVGAGHSASPVTAAAPQKAGKSVKRF